MIAGNTAPIVTIVIPEEGQFAAFGETVPYEITVTDAEDGSTEAGTIDCDDVTLNVSLGHDVHAHELSEQQRLRGHVPDGDRRRPRRQREHLPGHRGRLHGRGRRRRRRRP